MIIEFITGKEIKDDKSCNNCKWNVGYYQNNQNLIWCDKHLKKQYKYESCESYIFRLK